MPETQNVAPKFQQLTAANINEAGDVALQFRAEDEQLYKIELANAITGATVSTIIGVLGKHAPAALDDSKRQSDPIRALRLMAFRRTLTPEGNPGLTMVLEGSLEVMLEIKPEAIPALKSDLDQLDNLTAPPNGETKH